MIVIFAQQGPPPVEVPAPWLACVPIGLLLLVGLVIGAVAALIALGHRKTQARLDQLERRVRHLEAESRPAAERPGAPASEPSDQIMTPRPPSPA